MSLDEESRCFYPCRPIFACLDGFGKAGRRVRGLRMRVSSTVSEKSGKRRRSYRPVQAIHRTASIRASGICPSVRSGKNDRVRKALARQHLAQAMDGFRVAQIEKGHKERCWLFAIGS